MTSPHNLISLYKRTQWIIERQTDGLSHADSLLQLPFRANNLNWVMGHIVVYRSKALESLGEAALLNEAEYAVYMRESQPITDAQTALPLARLLQYAASACESIIGILDKLSSTELDKIVDSEQGRTLGDRLSFLHWHETYHVGQLEILRQLAGKDDAII